MPGRPSLVASRIGHRFTLLWAGQSASLLGDQVTLIALPLVATVHAGASTFEVGVLATLLKLPFLVIGLQAGVWVTRLGLARSMMGADVARGTALAVVVLMLASQERISLVALAGAVTAVGVATVFFQVAYQSYVPEVVEDPRHWHAANLRLSLSESTSLLAGPALGGFLISTVSLVGALVLDVGTYVLSVVTLAALAVSYRRRAGPSVEPAIAKIGMRAAITEGFRYVNGRPVLRGIMWAGATYNIGSAMFEATLVLFAVRDLHLSPSRLGLAIGVGACGYPLGGILSAPLNRRYGRGMILLLAAFPSVLGIAIAGTATGAPAQAVLGLGVFVIGVGQGAFAVNAVTLRQVHSAPAMRARATSVHRFASWGALPVGTLLAGAIGELLGLRAVTVVAAVLAAACFVPLSAAAMRHAE
ncbi:MFS transporter [Actinoplanes sp. URMC 104]|uniref:MFS transporter n=1 Tax=Actinoplanes sp. URMC 104 TaxID=3423409 RepID=UPI003F1AC217